MKLRGYVYILANEKYGTLYTGVTSNLPVRIHQHRTGTASAFTKKYNVTRMVWCEEHEWIVGAIQRETNLKRWKRDWKLALIDEMNPEWRDLYETLT